MLYNCSYCTHYVLESQAKYIKSKIQFDLNNGEYKECICKECLPHYRLDGKYKHSKYKNGHRISRHIFLNSNCEICNKEFSEYEKKVLDHEHKTNFVRGSLCHNCNIVIGHAKESIDTLQKTIEYLNKYKELEQEEINAIPKDYSNIFK